MADDRFLITGGTGCIGSWVVRGLVREGAPVTVVSTGRRRDRLELILTAGRAGRGRRRGGGRHRPRGDRGGRPAVGRDGDRPPRRPPAPVVRRGPGDGCARERPGDGHGLRARAAPRDRARGVREQRGRLRPQGPLRGRGGGPGRRALPHLALRRVQGRQRAGGARLLGDRAASRASACGPTPRTARAATRASPPSPPWR